MDQYWNYKALDDMTDDEWERLCDRCGRCCLVKLEDDRDGAVFYTNVVCAQFDQSKGQCGCYSKRYELVSDCLSIRSFSSTQFHWLPQSCAYRRIAENRPLADWHPLISGRYDSVHEAGISLAGKVISETDTLESELESHIVMWVD